MRPPSSTASTTMYHAAGFCGSRASEPQNGTTVFNPSDGTRAASRARTSSVTGRFSACWKIRSASAAASLARTGESTGTVMYLPEWLCSHRKRLQIFPETARQDRAASEQTPPLLSRNPVYLLHRSGFLRTSVHKSAGYVADAAEPSVSCNSPPDPGVIDSMELKISGVRMYRPMMARLEGASEGFGFSTMLRIRNRRSRRAVVLDRIGVHHSVRGNRVAAALP